MAAPGASPPKENGSSSSKKQAGKRKRASVDAPASSVPSLSEIQSPVVLTQQAATELLQVFELLDAGLLDASLAPSVGSSKASIKHPSLRDALQASTPVSINDLRDHVRRLLPVLSQHDPPLPDLPAHSEGSTKKRTIDEEEELLIAQSARIEAADRADEIREGRERWKAQVLLILDQVESQLRNGEQDSAAAQTPSEGLSALSQVKRVRSTRKLRGKLAQAPLLPVQGAANPEQKVVLHRALLNSLDVFGSGGDLTMDELLGNPTLLAELQQLEDTDVVGVESIEGSTYLRRPATTLGQISRPPRPTPASVSAGRPDLSRIPDPRPVVNLYFDPFSSYAPTYDSSDANLSYVSSARYLTSQESAGELASQSLLARTYSDAVDASSASVPQNEDPTQGAADVDDLLAKHLNLGSKADLERMLEAAPSEWESTEGTLRSISTILFDLQLSQLDRLRQQAIQMRTLPLADLHCPNGKASTVKLSELEAAQAAEVLEKLTQLAAAVQPKHLTQASERDSLARALKAPFLEARDDPAALAPSFSGTLPADHAGVLRENLLTRVEASNKKRK